MSLDATQLQTLPSENRLELTNRLSREDLGLFARRGLIKVPSVFDHQKAEQIQEELWRRFSNWGIERGQPETWESMSELSLRGLMKATRKVAGLSSIYSTDVERIAQTLTNESDFDRAKALLLLTFSHQHQYIGHERVPRSMWHSDTPNLPGSGVSGVIVLGFINKVEAKGGGTMVIAGSHRLFESSSSAISSKIAKRKLKRHPYFRNLFSKQAENRSSFLEEPGYIGDVELQIEELTGEPGDAYFVNGSILHTICRNFNHEPRMMVRGFYGTKKLSSYYQDKYQIKQTSSTEY